MCYYVNFNIGYLRRDIPAFVFHVDYEADWRQHGDSGGHFFYYSCLYSDSCNHSIWKQKTRLASVRYNAEFGMENAGNDFQHILVGYYII